jgi:hypothetical protein
MAGTAMAEEDGGEPGRRVGRTNLVNVAPLDRRAARRRRTGGRGSFGVLSLGGEPDVPGDAPDGKRPPGGTVSAQHCGHDQLWTVLWPHGVIAATKDYVERDGSVGTKFPWWRGAGVVGKLRITGQRLDAPAPPLRGLVGAGYGRTGFQATGIYFPTEGCCEVTGRAGRASLTFVTIVLKV